MFFCFFVIAVTVFYTCHPLGIFLGSAAFCWPYPECWSGVHFTKTSLAGAVWDPVRDDPIYFIGSVSVLAGSTFAGTGFLLSFCGRNAMNRSTLTSIRIG